MKRVYAVVITNLAATSIWQFYFTNKGNKRILFSEEFEKFQKRFVKVVQHML